MISIVIPAHNEEKRIKITLEEYLRFFLSKKEEKEIENFEIIVVLNGCKDNTLKIVKSFKNKELSCLNFEKSGKGFAVVEGFKAAKGNLIGFVDADMATMPEEFYKLIKNINGYDGIIASRYVKGAVVKPKQSFKRIIASRVFNFIVRILFFVPYKDTQCGAKVFRREVIERTIKKIGMTEWAFDVELLYKIKKEGFRIKEYPTIWSDKEYSKVDFFKDGPKMLLSIIRLRLINSKGKFLVRAYDKLPEWAKIQKILLK